MWPKAVKRTIAAVIAPTTKYPSKPGRDRTVSNAPRGETVLDRSRAMLAVARRRNVCRFSTPQPSHPCPLEVHLGLLVSIRDPRLAPSMTTPPWSRSSPAGTTNRPGAVRGLRCGSASFRTDFAWWRDHHRSCRPRRPSDFIGAKGGAVAWSHLARVTWC